MSGKTLFVVTLEGRPTPIVIEAENMGCCDDTVYFKNGSETVASVPKVEFVARCDALGSASSRAAGLLCEPPRAVPVPPAMQYAELGLAEIEPYKAPFWPALAYFVGGLGVGSALSAWAALLS